MSEEKLSGLMGHLTELLEDGVDSPVQAQLLNYMERHKHAEGEEDKADPGLTDLVKQGVTEFEQSHPRIAGVLEEILDVLAKMGV